MSLSTLNPLEGFYDMKTICFISDTKITPTQPQATLEKKKTPKSASVVVLTKDPNGQFWTQARVNTLDRLSVGAITVKDVEAIVVPKGLDISLLGMTYLGELQSVEANRATLTLRY